MNNGDIASELGDLLSDHRPFHSEFQIDNFIVRKSAPTAWGQYVQVLRELDSRVEELRRAYVEIERLKIDVEEFVATKPRGGSNDFKRRRLVLDELELNRRLSQAEKMQADREREFARFYSIGLSLRSAIGPVDEERRQLLDADLWRARLVETLYFEKRSSTGISKETIETLAALPSEMARAALEESEEEEVAARFFVSRNRETVAPGEVRRLVCR
jgi:hypothetical protein